jgi:hypothetical protein
MGHLGYAPTDDIAMSNKQAHVDDADVDELVSLLTRNSGRTNLTAESRADLAHKFALSFAKLKGHSTEWAKELARRVRQRMLWVKPSL